MTTGERNRAQDAAGEYWDALNQGVSRPEVPDLDPSFASIIDRVRTLDDARSPDLDFVTRLEQQIMRSSATTWFDLSVSQTHLTSSANGRREGLFLPVSLPRVDRPGRQWMASLVTAALLLLTLVAGYVAFGGALRPRQQDDMLAAIPAIEATPDGSPSAGLTQETILFQQRIEVIPDGAGWTGIEHYTFAPGETWTQGKTRGAGLGPMLYRLEVGTMTVRAAAPFTLTRAEASAATEVPQETEVVLEPGDAVFMPFGVTSEWRNDGTSPAQLLEAGIALTGTQAKVIDYAYDAFPSAWPPTPVELTLRRRTLPPGGHMPIAAEPGLAYLGVESGDLTLIWVDRATPPTNPRETQVGPPGSSMSRPVTDLRRPGASRVAQELRNDSDAPVTFLVWTIRPVGEVASDEQQATPAPGVTAEEELLAVALPAEALPHGGDVILGLLHYTIPPTTEGTWPPAQPATGCPQVGCPGVELAYVLEGGLTVTAARPLQVVRAAGRGEAEPIPAGTALTLGPGDATLRPNGTTADYANAGATPVQLVLGYLAPGGILTYRSPLGWDMHDEESFSGGQLSEVSGPATLRLRRAVLAADAVFAATPGAVAQVGIAESDPPALGSQSDGALVNAGDEAATVYALALEPTELRNATPAATS